MSPWKFLLVFLGICAIVTAAAAVWAEGGDSACDGYWDHLGPGEAVCRPHGEVSPHLPEDYGTAQSPAITANSPPITAEPTAVLQRHDTGWLYAYCPEGETILSNAYNTGESRISYYCGRP